MVDRCAVTELSDDMVCVEKISVPRPHYRVTITTSMRGHPDLLPGLLRDELAMTVCLPMDIGTDLNTIKRAAARRLAANAAKISNHHLTRHNGNGRSQEDHQLVGVENGAE